jgi:hypothetical protein
MPSQQTNRPPPNAIRAGNCIILHKSGVTKSAVTETSGCHAERSEASLKLLVGFFASLRMTVRHAMGGNDIGA